MLKDEKFSEMRLMCTLAIKSDAVLKRLNEIFEEHISKEGLDKIEKCANEASKVNLSK